MRSLITSYLLQSNECALPGIGVLKIIHTPASTDSGSNRILPPFKAIIFKKDGNHDAAGLVNYIATKKDVDQQEAKSRLDNFCKEWEARINAGEKLNFETIGSIHKDADGGVVFEKEKRFELFQPVRVENVYPKKEQAVSLSQQAIALPDEPVSYPEAPIVLEEAAVKEDVVIERSYWGIWALILLAVGFVMLFYHFKDHKLSGANVGNQHKYTTDPPRATYTLPK